MTDENKKGLRTGFTTGACSAAAARAAVIGLVGGSIPERVETLLPNGSKVTFAVAVGECDGQQARAVVVKDAGDDPDVTNRARLTACVTCQGAKPGEVTITGGEGVGRVTLPGLGLEVGVSAINPVPMRNIEENLRLAAQELIDEKGVVVTISVPDGEKMAKKTLNGRLGIIGGISILGTTGIVKPFSTSAYRDCVIQSVQVAAATGSKKVALGTGGRTEAFLQRLLPDLPEPCFIQMGDFIQVALDQTVAEGINEVVVGVMAGKAAKIASGVPNTHAKHSDVDIDWVATIAQEAGANQADCEAIAAAPTVRFAAELLERRGLATPFFTLLAQRAARSIKERTGGKVAAKVVVCDFNGERLMAEAMEEKE